MTIENMVLAAVGLVGLIFALVIVALDRRLRAKSEELDSGNPLSSF